MVLCLRLCEVSVYLSLDLSGSLGSAAWAGCRDGAGGTLSAPPCTPRPPAPAPSQARSAAGTHAGGRHAGRAGRGIEAGRPPRALPDLGASFHSHKGGNGSEKGSAWSRSPGGDVGGSTRTRVLATPKAPGSCLSRGEAERDRGCKDTERWHTPIETVETETVRTETQRSREMLRKTPIYIRAGDRVTET